MAEPDIPFRGGGGGGGEGHEMRLNAKGTVGSFGGRKLIYYNKIITRKNVYPMTSRIRQKTGVRCCFRAGLWDFSPNSLLIHLGTVLERIAIPCKRTMARIFLEELFVEHTTTCLTERTSLCVVFRGRPDLFLSWNGHQQPIELFLVPTSAPRLV